MAPFLTRADSAVKSLAISHAGIWLLGLFTFLGGSRSISRRVKERDRAQAALEKLTEELEARVAARTADMRNRQRQLQAFMDNTDAAVCIRNREHEFVMVNNRLAAMLRASPEAPAGGLSLAGLPGEAGALFLECEERVLAGKTSLEAEFFTRPASPFPPHSAFFFPIIDSENEEMNGIGCIMVDISKRKQVEEALVEAKEAAENANRAKNDFLANISHEIRTPLNGVLGMADLMLRTNLTGDQTSMAATIKNSGDSLLNVLNDILDFSKIEAGKMVMENMPFSLRDAVRDAVESMAPVAYKKKIAISVNIASAIPDNLEGDVQRLRQIFLNLLSNAIKFTERGEITVAAQVLEKHKDRARLRMSVTDTGIGIPLDKQKQIFAAFEQADSSTTRQYGGTGLGLAICSRLARLMDSELCLESRPGCGSIFWMDVTLPFLEEAPPRGPLILTGIPDQPARPEELPHSPGAALELRENTKKLQTGAEDKGRNAKSFRPALKTLLVEDMEMNQLVASRMLRDLGHAVRVAANGRQALELLEEERFDLVFMDIQMPVLDGQQTTRILREKEAADPARGRLPIVAMTAHAMKEDREKYLAGGMDGYLAKPLLISNLSKVIDEMAALFHLRNAAETGALTEEALDQETLAAAFGNDADLLRQGMGIYIRDSSPLLAGIEAALAAGDNSRLAVEAHTLKGLTGYYTKGEVYRNCLALERAGRDGRLPEDAARLAGLHAALRTRVARLWAAMRARIQK
jgi:signal transduction histidine kinase/CheY-like chemotaxis protein